MHAFKTVLYASKLLDKVKMKVINFLTRNHMTDKNNFLQNTENCVIILRMSPATIHIYRSLPQHLLYDCSE